MTVYLDVKLTAQPDGVVPVAWCVEPPLVELIKQRGFRNPHVLVVTRHVGATAVAGHDFTSYTDTNTQVVPLKSALTFAQFQRPGDNEVCAVVVDLAERSDAKRAHRLVKQTRAGTPWGTSLFHADGKPRVSGGSRALTLIPFLPETASRLPVTVDPSMFAAEPAPWRRRLVARFFGADRGKDECAFRRRFWFLALPAAPFYVLGSYVARLGLLVAALLYGSRNVRALPPHVWRAWTTPGMAWSALDERNNTSLWFETKDGGSRGAWSWVVNPFALSIAPSIAWGIIHIHMHHGKSPRTYQLADWGWWQTVLYVDGGLVLLLGLVFLVVLGASGLGGASSWLLGLSAPARERHRQDAHERAVARERARALESAQALACNGRELPKNVGDLKFTQVTPRLVYLSAKRAVCRPFAR